MIEAELTAVVRDPHRVRTELARLATAEHSTYHDVYYDRPDHSMDAAGHELRLRTVTTDDDSWTLLTYKEPAVDEASGSKPEHETRVDDPRVIDTVLRSLGLVELIAFRKNCENHRFVRDGRDLLATVVEIPDLDGETFVEIEALAEQDQLSDALDTIRAVLHDLGVSDEDQTGTSYTDRVADRRRG